MSQPDIKAAMRQYRQTFDAMIAACDGLPPLPTAVVCPQDEKSLGGALLAAEKGLIDPVFFGVPEKIQAAAAEDGSDISAIPLVATGDGEAAAAVEAVHAGRIKALMKGHIHTDELLVHVTKRDGGLRAGRRMSHIFAMDVPGREESLLITDAAMNIAPDARTALHIIQNAVDLGQSIGMETPRVALLSATETPTDRMPSSRAADEVARRAMDGAVSGGVVDGPFAMDNAISLDAAETKGLSGPVAGRAQILVVPGIEAGNILFKALTFLGGAECAGIVVGARVPVMLTSRADSEEARLVSCALAALYGRWQDRQG